MSDKPIPCRAKKSEHTGDRIYWCTDPEWIEKLGGPTHEIWPIERSWFCGACGWQPEGGVSATWEELQDHIATCEKHPSSKLRAEIKRLREQNGLLLGEIARRSEAHARRIEELNLVIHEKAERLDDLVGDGVKPCDRDLVQRLRSLTGTRADGIAAAKRIEELEKETHGMVEDAAGIDI